MRWKISVPRNLEQRKLSVRGSIPRDILRNDAKAPVASSAKHIEFDARDLPDEFAKGRGSSAKISDFYDSA